MTKKLSATAQWMLDHPNDEPPPSDPRRAREWRIERRLDRGPWADHNDAREQADVARYETAMAEKREYEAKHGPMRPQQGETR